MAHPPYFANAAVFSVSPDQVDVDQPGRIGLFYPAKAEALAVLIGMHGQNDPIKVVKRGNAAKVPWKLVAGLHRLEACRIAGLDCYAIEINGGELTGEGRLAHIQASENMDRRELAPVERALFVNAVAESAKARLSARHPGLSQQQIAGAKGGKANKVQFTDLQKADERASEALDILSTAYSWKHETAEACGLGQKDVQRSIRIFDCIVRDNRDLMDRFKDLDVANNASQLLEICAVKDAGMRRKVIELLVTGPKDLGMVLTMLKLKDQPAESNPYAKATSAIVSGWDRLGTAEKRRFIPEWVAGMPAGLKQMLRDELNRPEEQGQ